MNDRAMIVAGVMSGTSADGINVALVRIGGKAHSDRVSSRGRKHQSRIKLLAHAQYSYPTPVRTAILAAMNAERASVADLARLNVLLGTLYAEAVLAAQTKFGLKADLVGCHGQTIYHQGEATTFLRRRVSTTWQTGEAAIIASRVDVPVVSDFRPADMAVGGKGAPLVPFLDYILFRDDEIGRIVQNVGGIANLTAIPAAATTEDVIAFDTGPGNMVIDQVTEKLFRKPFDRGGRFAASGRVIDSVVEAILKRAFFRARPPKTAGREEFGREFVGEFLRACGKSRKEDVVATATAVTARSISEAVKRFVMPIGRQSFREMILSGGGAKNSTLVRMLKENLEAMGVRLRFSDEFGLPSEAKEAVAFAVLAYKTWHRRPSNVASATGAKRPAILGKISYA